MAKRILVVDDEQDVRSFISTLLKDAGYEVVTAENGNRAMDAVEASPPDLVSLDISMPEKSGLKFYREMKTDPATRAIPILIVTGIQNPWAAPDGTGSFEHFISSRKQVPPPEGYFEKPVKPEEFLAKVASLLE